jgi:hypothetical protein
MTPSGLAHSRIRVLSPYTRPRVSSQKSGPDAARSYLGAVVLHCGGLLVDHGWLRVFGSPVSGAVRGVPGLARVNRFPGVFDSAWRPDAGLVVAHDVLGGVFALNGEAPPASAAPVPLVRSSTSPRIPLVGKPWVSVTRCGWPGWHQGHSMSSMRICAGPDG